MEDGKVERSRPPGDMVGGAKRQELRLGAHSSSTSSHPRSSSSPSFYRSFISLLFPDSFTDSSSSTSFMMSKVKDHS